MTAYLVRYLLCKHEDLSFIPSADGIMPGTDVCAPVIPVLRKRRQGEPWCLPASSRLSELASSRSVRDHLKK